LHIFFLHAFLHVSGTHLINYTFRTDAGEIIETHFFL
jgi:hypothetical protein